MPDALLQRIESSDQGTFGRFFAGPFSLYSGELPDRQNEKSYSRVNAGTYWAAFTTSPRFGRCLYLLDRVPGRDGIRIHSANYVGDSRKGYRAQLNGCIAFGERLGWMDGQKALVLSAPAMRRLESFFGGRPFQLEIRDPD